MKDEKKYYYPNTTQKPNIVFDVIMPKIGKEKPLAYLVLDAMIRKIYGWGKHEDNISNSQLVEMTGLSPDTVRDSVEYLIKNKFVEQLIKGHGKTISRYRLTLNEYIANEIEADEIRGSQQPPLEVVNTDLSKSEGLPKPTTEVANTDHRGSQQQPPEVASSHLQNLIKPNIQNLKEKEEKKNEFPSQEKVSKFFEHHLETAKRLFSRETEMFNVDKLGILLDWSIEEYDKLVYTKQNSSWEPRRKQPNTARWLIATLQNEALMSPSILKNAIVDNTWETFIAWSKRFLTAGLIEEIVQVKANLKDKTILVETEISERAKKIIEKYFSELDTPVKLLISK